MKKYLECPHCGEEIEVTWRRYWTSAFNRYWFPECKHASRFATKPPWIQFASWVFQLVALVPIFLFSDTLWMWLVLIPAYAVIFLFDKRLDERFGILVGGPEN